MFLSGITRFVTSALIIDLVVQNVVKQDLESMCKVRKMREMLAKGKRRRHIRLNKTVLEEIREKQVRLVRSVSISSLVEAHGMTYSNGKFHDSKSDISSLYHL